MCRSAATYFQPVRPVRVTALPSHTGQKVKQNKSLIIVGNARAEIIVEYRLHKTATTHANNTKFSRDKVSGLALEAGMDADRAFGLLSRATLIGQSTFRL